MPNEVLLRGVVEADLPIFYLQQLDPVATDMAAFPMREREPFMQHWRKIMADPALYQRTVLADGQVAGNIVSFVQDGEREVGYWIGREFWGRGIATRALHLLLDELSDRPLYAHVAAHNIGSRRVLAKCGFRLLREQLAEDGIREHVMILE